MGVNYLIDTNVAIDYINDKLPESIAHVIDNATLNISVITRMELLVWKSATTGHLAIIQNFISACNVYDLAELIILEGIHIRKNSGIKLPDAIIAATAIVNDLTLLTRNTKDFAKLTGLQVTDPWIA